MPGRDFDEIEDSLGEIVVTTPKNVESAPIQKPKKSPIRLIVIAIVALIGGIYCFRTYEYGSTHISTDNAFITADIVPVNSTIAGTVVKINVNDNQQVNAGDILVELSSDSRRANVDEAEANLAAAKATAGGASVDVQMAEQTGYAQVSQAKQAIQLGSSDIAVAQANTQRAASALTTAQAGIAKSKADVRAAQAVVDARQSTLRRVREQIATNKAQISSAQSSLRAAESNFASTKSIAENASSEASRAQTLVKDGAISQAEADAKSTTASSTKSAAESARQQVDVARFLISQRQSELAVATEQITEAEAGVSQAKAQVSALRDSVNAMVAQANEARSGLYAAKQAVSAADLRRSQAEGKLKETQADGKRVGVSQGNQQTALAKIKQAAAALKTAQINLESTKLRALIAGVISMKTVQMGMEVAPGQQLMAVVPVSTPWVVANFKETQLADIHAGRHVQVEIDALPGMHFRAHVDSISSGTGATFALLPPDNATGNFTKVVQRVPVKIVFEPGQRNMDKLRAGLSSKVAIALKG